MPISRNKLAKQIVYLLGAGATQAEVDYAGVQGVNLLMHNNERGEGISTRVLKRIGRQRKLFIGEEERVDIEKLISLLAASGVARLSFLAEQMRRFYFREILSSLITSKVLRRPKLARGLLEMHKNDYFKERVEHLSGIITTNHDGLLQIAFQQTFNKINLGFPFDSKDFSAADSNGIPTLLQLHGSFTWQFAVPIKVSTLRRTSKYLQDTSWIPPTITKESKNYPFNKIAAMAYELLAKRCDVLRVIGSSLTQNDWNVISLIFNAQRHREIHGETAFRIELIVPQKDGLDVSKQCAYLKNLTPIGFLSEGEFDEYKEEEEEEKIPGEMKNIFAYWLKQKIYYHKSRKEFDPAYFTDTMAEIAGWEAINEAKN